MFGDMTVLRLPSMRQDRRNPEGRRRSAGRTPSGLEGRRSTSARRHLSAADRPARRRRLLARVRVVAGAPVRCLNPGCLDGAKTSFHALVRWGPQGPEQGARQGARDDQHPRRAVGRDEGQGRDDAEHADRLLCESWNERMWSDGEPIDPSPTIDQAINGGFPWLEIQCSRCKTPSDVDLAAMKHPPTTFVHDLASRLRCSKCAKAGKRPAATLLQLARRPSHEN